MLVAAYIEELTRERSPATVKQHPRGAADALRLARPSARPFRFNPASSVRGPRQVVKTGKTPILSAKETRALLDGIDVSNLVGLRDRAFLGILVYSFARVSAAISTSGRGLLHAGGRGRSSGSTRRAARYNVVPAHHVAQGYVDAYPRGRADRRGPSRAALPKRRARAARCAPGTGGCRGWVRSR